MAYPIKTTATQLIGEATRVNFLLFSVGCQRTLLVQVREGPSFHSRG